MKPKKNFYFIYILSCLILIIFFCFAFLVKTEETIIFASDNELYEEKIYDNYYESEFDYDKVIVVFDVYHSEPNKEISKLFFYDSEIIDEIRDLTYKENLESFIKKDIKNFRQIILLHLNINSREALIEFIEKNKELPGIMWIGPNYCYDTKTNDDYISEIDNFEALYADELWGLYGSHGINANLARNFESGSSLVKVAVMDTGICNHEDFSTLLGTGYDAVNENNITNDSTNSHGTQVAGIISATYTGVSRNISLIPIQIYDNDGAGCNDVVLIKAFNWAEDNDIDVINFSSGWYNYINPSLKSIIEQFQGLLVVSAGNEGIDNDTIPEYLSELSYGYDNSNRVISVGGIDPNGDVAIYETGSSNFGANKVSIFAPGLNIITTDLNNEYVISGGTSLAAPFVSGVAGLIYSIYENNAHLISRNEIAIKVKNLILSNARINSSLTNLCSCGGELDAYASIVKTPYLTATSNFGYLENWYNWRGKLDLKLSDTGWTYNNNILQINSNQILNFGVITTRVYNAWHEINVTISYELKDQNGNVVNLNNTIYDTNINVNLVSLPTYSNRFFTIDTNDFGNGTYTLYLYCSATRNGETYTQTKSFTFVKDVSSCITEGTKVTLSNGTQVNVENLTGNETLLAWDMFNGCLVSAPILFIDRENIDSYNVINLTFSDGSITKVVSDHGFFDVTLGKYVYITEDTAYDYIGHSFNKGNTNVSLVSVNIQEEYTRVYSPVTYGYLCYYTNGMLSMPGNTEIFANIFSIDSETLRYINVNEDIENYGLYTYEEFNNLIEIDEYVFNAFKGEYLKIAIGKGITNLNEIQALLDRYSVFFE